jgi:DNA-binding protein HU-beta
VAVNKSELIEAVATTAGLDKKQAEVAVGAFVDSVMTKTKSGEPVSIFGFGTFKPTARAGRNPQTGAAVKIAASKSVKFQPATAFKTVLNTRGAKKAATPAKKTVVKKAAPPAKKVTATAKKTTAPAKKAPVAKKAAVPANKAVKATKTAKKR